jgi:hypothetical protein
MEFDFSFSRPGKSLNFISGYGKSWNLPKKKNKMKCSSVLRVFDVSAVSCFMRFEWRTNHVCLVASDRLDTF